MPAFTKTEEQKNNITLTDTYMTDKNDLLTDNS